MSFYFFLYLCIGGILSILSYVSLRKINRKPSDIYFSIATMGFALWLVLYFISFTTTYNPEILLYLSRGMYFLGCFSMYFLVFYILTERKTLFPTIFKYHKLFFIFIFFIGIITLFSDIVINTMIYSHEYGLYYEDFGVGIYFYLILYLLYLPLFFYSGIKKISLLHNLEKIRFKVLFFGLSFLVLGWYLVLGLLPVLGIWVLQKEQVLFFIPFILSVYYVSYRYQFLDTYVFLTQGVKVIFATTGSVFLIHIFNHYIHDLMDARLMSFWSDFGGSNIVSYLLIIYLYIMIMGILEKYLPVKKYSEYVLKINILKKKISHLFSIDLINRLLLSEKGVFQTSFVFLIEGKNLLNNELIQYFEKYTKVGFFLNDSLYLQENKYKFDLKNILDSLPDNAYLILPLRVAGKINTFLCLGRKTLGDIYSAQEIEIIKDFVGFLEEHLKYLNMHQQAYELNLNLDKKVDEKTMQYNNLISKQSDFISMASHEIKSPLGGAIFQLDCLIDDIQENTVKKEDILEELRILNDQLIKVANLTKNIFSVQKYDLEKVQLYRQKVDIIGLIQDKLDWFGRLFPETKFIFENNIAENYYFEIDKIQIEQVFDNLINNSLKFTLKSKSIIEIECECIKGGILIHLRDNGRGFKNNEEHTIFDKYSSGNTSGTGLGMGLYLCKRIVELHNGYIKAYNSEKYGGAEFEFKICQDILTE